MIVSRDQLIIDAVLREANIVDTPDKGKMPAYDTRQEEFDNYMQEHPEEDEKLNDLVGKLYN